MKTPPAVGFRTFFATDYSRRYGTDAFRPVLVALWYPAEKPADAAPMCYGDYLTVSSNDENYRAFAERLTAYNREVTVQYSLDNKPERLPERERLPMQAFRDATPLPERFPVVIYHPGLGGSYDDNSLLCESLAGAGYVVVSSAYSPEDAATLHLDWDLERSFHDLGFLMNVIATLPQADVSQVALVGQSFGGQAAMAFTFTTNCPLKAIVSLDSTVEYTPLDDPRRETLRKALTPVENVRVPWLLFAVKEVNPNWSWWDALTAIPRWFAATAPLEHNDFTSQGMLGTIERHPDPDEAQRIRQRYDAVCALTLQFLDVCLKALPTLEATQEALTSAESPIELIYLAPGSARLPELLPTLAPLTGG